MTYSSNYPSVVSGRTGLVYAPTKDGLAPDVIVAASRDVEDADQMPPALPLPEFSHGVPPSAFSLWLSAHPFKAAASSLGISLLVEMMIGLPVPWPITLAAPFAILYYLKRRYRIEREAAAADQQRREALAQTRYDTARYRWEQTRPFAVIARSSHPIRQLWAYSKPSASIYLGVSPDTQAFVMTARDRSMLVLGVTRTGKTRRSSIPMQLTHTGPLVSVSTKTDAYQEIAPGRSQIGRNWIFDPSGETSKPDLSAGMTWLQWSPLWTCKQWDPSKLTARALIGATPVGGEKANQDNVHWTITAEKFLAPLLFAAALHPDCNITDVRRWVNLGDFARPMAILRAVEGSHDSALDVDAGLAIENLSAVMDYDGRQRSGVISTAQTVTDAYNYTSVLSTCLEQNFDPDQFVRSTDTVHIIASSSRQAAVAPIIAAFLTGIQEATYAHNRAVPFLSSDRPSVLVVLNEVANIAPVKELPRYLSEGGGQGLQVVVMFQNLQQAEVSWPVQGKALLGYFAVKVVLSGQSDKTTLEALSTLSGDFMRPYVTTSNSATSTVTESRSDGTGRSGSQATSSQSTTYGESKSRTVGTQTSHRKERRLSEADISTLPVGTALVHQLEGWRFIDLVGIESPVWRAIAHLTPLRLPANEIAPRLSNAAELRLAAIAELLAAERLRLGL